LYTSQTWNWAGLPCAHLFATEDAKRVFDVTNAALAAASLFQRKAAPLRHSLLHRHTMIDHLLRESGTRCVVELAAGLSRRGAAFSSDPAIHYTELDLPAVVAKKRELLERTDEGRAVLARPNLVLVEADVAVADLGAHVVQGAPVIVIAEGLMMYLDAAAQRALFAKVRALTAIARDVRFVFDLVPGAEEPPPGAVGRALEAAMKRFTGGRSFERDTRTRDDLVADLRAAGFDDVRAIDSTAVARAWDLPHPDEPTRTVLFDSHARTSSAAAA
jgi:O-methyltransferase involved in polyketide biosynthesis